jgi:hypothetical protein
MEAVRVRTLARTASRQISPHSFGVRVMLLAQPPEGVTARRLADFGSLVDTETEFYAALSGILDDPMGYDLFVMECDAFGGMAAAERAIATLIAADAKMRVILISREFDVPCYPMGRRTAVCLPDPVAEPSFRIGFDHVLRDRVALRLL